MTVWVSKLVVLAIHDEQLAEHGGAAGLRDLGALESALDRVKNLEAYGGNDVDIAALAAAYAIGIARNHAFLDGNKRTSSVATRMFLRLNGFDFTADQATRLAIWERIAAGALTETDLANWIRVNIAKK